MNFTEPVFLFLYLPCVLVGTFALPRSWRNAFLMLASLLFYGVGEPAFLPILIASCLVNYVAALAVERGRESRLAWLCLVLAVTGNVLLLAGFKYATFAVSILNDFAKAAGAGPFQLPEWWPVHLPLGISFFTFHAISYVVDVFRGTNRAERNPLNVVLYVTFFPQLIAGPIIRFHDVADQLRTRTVGVDDFSEGIGRFIVGLGKKMLIANTVAVAADEIFAVPGSQLTADVAWFGILCYAIQIYYDFSGYSDMAIGLGRMFGFRFLENFNYPYAASSITEFWHRWHISLSNWFRDYLYIPLGGSRVSPGRTYANLLVVFFLCGLWHGASLNFVAWGLFHGAFLVIERLGATTWITQRVKPLGHLYVLLVVCVGWVLFRAPTFSVASAYLLAMAGLSGSAGAEFHLGLYANQLTLVALAVGCVGSMPIIPQFTKSVQSLRETLFSDSIRVVTEMVTLVALVGIFSASVMLSAAGTYNPFIYFQF